MDSELQIGLLALGVAAVVGIIAYNKWQEHKHNRHTEKTFRSDHRDVLLETGEPVEPRIEPRAADDGEGPAEAPAPVAAAPQPGAHGRTGGRQTTPGAPDAVDARIDCIIRVEAIEPLEAPRLWAAQRDALQELEKPVRWFAFDDRENVWRPLTAHSAGAYHWFCAAMQMVDRRGAITEQDFQRFSGGVQAVADQFLAVPADIPARATALGNAATLDQFCASVDVQVGVNIITEGDPFPGTKIRALAEAGGMVFGDDGAFHARDDEGRTLYTLSNLEAGLFSASEMRNLHTRGITLLIDVPLVSDGAGVFDRMMRHANQIADVLHGRVVDDNRAPFGAEAAALIRTQIRQFQAQMDAERIPAGGALASRLFSA